MCLRAAILASPQAANEKVTLTDEQSARIAAFNDEGKTISVLLVDDQVVGLFAIRDERAPMPSPGSRLSVTLASRL